jgi:hypothetical protein
MIRIIVRIASAIGLSFATFILYAIANDKLFNSTLPFPKENGLQFGLVAGLAVPYFLLFGKFWENNSQIAEPITLADLGVASGTEAMPVLCANIRRRADRRRAFANTSVYGIVAVVGVTILFFFGSSQFAADSSPTEKQIFLKERDQPIDLPQQPQGDQETKLRVENSALKSQLEDKTLQQRAILLSVTSTLLRFASVGLAVFLVQILVNFTRYSYRMADYLDSLADFLLTVSPDQRQAQAMTEIFSSKHIDFGRPALYAPEKVIDVLKEIATKIGPK